MEFRRTFSVPEWNSEVQSRVIEYWRGRGVELRPEQDGRLVGRRGSLWGNMFAIAISKAPTTVYVRCAGPTVECVMDLDPRFRGITPITPANRSYLHLELAIFESFLLRGDLQPEAWIEHKRAASRATRELIDMMFKNNLSRTGTKVVAGSLKARGWFMLLIAMVMTPVFLKWGPSIFSSIELLEGRRPRPLDEFGRIMFGPIAASILGIIFFVMAIWLFKLHRESAACLRLDDAAERLGVDTRDLARIIEERGVRPRFMRDGELVYTIDDITGAANLLRPADNVPADALLRPAASARTGEVASMLRPILVSAQDSTIKEPAGDEQVIRTQSREK